MTAKLSSIQIRDLTQKWDDKLKIKKQIFLTTNARIYDEHAKILDKNSPQKLECLFGATTVTDKFAIIFINKKNNQNKTETERTVVHELLHVKFPNKSEKTIQKLTKENFR